MTCIFGSYRYFFMNILPKCMCSGERITVPAANEPIVPLLSFTTVCGSRQFGCLSEYHHECVCDGSWSTHQPLENTSPPYPRPRHCRTLGKGAVCELVCASDGHDGLGPRRVIGLGCCCQDKQLCLCLGQVFHSVSAY